MQTLPSPVQKGYPMTATPNTAALTEAEFVERYVTHTLKTCGFTTFDDGYDVATYAREAAAASWSDPDHRSEGPETCAEGDMEYWGEE